MLADASGVTTSTDFTTSSYKEFGAASTGGGTDYSGDIANLQNKLSLLFPLNPYVDKAVDFFSNYATINDTTKSISLRGITNLFSSRGVDINATTGIVNADGTNVVSGFTALDVPPNNQTENSNYLRLYIRVPSNGNRTLFGCN